MLRTRLFVSHEIASAIDDFFVGYWLLGSLEALGALAEINPQLKKFFFFSLTTLTTLTTLTI